MAVAQRTVTTAQAVTTTRTRPRRLGPILVNVILAIICILWTIPTLGLLISSFRARDDISNTPWWAVFPHQAWVTANQVQLPAGIALDKPLQIPGISVPVTDDQLRAGVTLPDGRLLKWANRRSRLVDVQQQQLTTVAHFTFDNYTHVMVHGTFTTTDANGNVSTTQGGDMGGAFISTITVAVPSTIIPILIAAFAAYAFAWMRFPGRRLLFGIVVALLVVPLQVALISVLTLYTNLKINGTFLGMWLAHSGFGLPLATYLLFNYISQLPRDIFESAFIDGASPFTVFTRLVLPLSVPALASFAIFQFLWVWNDYLVALIFLGSVPGKQVLTMRLADIVGSRGQDWYLLTAGAFISMIIPLIIFFALQRYFVRGLLAGSVKG
jgi:alpha-glucoside transport system permease protein